MVRPMEMQTETKARVEHGIAQAGFQPSPEKSAQVGWLAAGLAFLALLILT